MKAINRIFLICFLFVTVWAVGCGQVIAGYQSPDRGKPFTANQLFKVVLQLEDARPLTRERIKEITGRELLPHDVWSFGSDIDDSDLVAHIEATQDRQGQINWVSVTVNPKLCVTPGDVQSFFGKCQRIDRHPEIHSLTNKTPVRYVYRRKGRYTAFEFEQLANDSILRCVDL